MATTAISTFSTAFWRQFGRLPVWTPGTRIELGDIGVLTDQGWSKVSSLAAQQISFVPEPGQVLADYNLTTSHGTHFTVKADASVTVEGVNPAHAGIAFGFSSAGAFAFSATGCRVDQMTDLASVQQQMLAAAARGAWQRDWIVVSAVIDAQRAVVAVSGDGGAKASLDLGVDLAGLPAGTAVSLGQANTAAGFTFADNMAADFLTLQPTTVMYQAWRITHSVFSGSHADPVQGIRFPGPDEGGHEHIPVVSPVEGF